MKKRPPTKRQSDFRLPPTVSMHKEQLPSGWAYVFRHATLGLLGRLVVQSKYSCGLAMIVFEEPTEPLSALDRRVRVGLLLH
jgi:hypothetical protein